jgi:hypothetical protein
MVDIAIASLKNRTACGEGGVQTELIKYGTRKLFNLLRSLFEICLNGEVPETWKIGLISVIHKKGRNGECKNHRGITVMNIFSRVYGKIIKYYLEESYKQKETEIQAGFRSIIDHVFLIKQLIENTNNNNKQKVHFTFVDMEKHMTLYPYKNCGKLWKTWKLTR